MKLKDFLKKHDLNEGDHVELHSGRETLSGTIIPGGSEEALSLKLDNGYNIGIEAGKIRQIRKVKEGKKVGKPPVNQAKKNPALPTISILHTGGTIASRIDYKTGGVYAAFSADDLLTMFPELAEIANFETSVALNKMSEDFTFGDIAKVAAAVKKQAESGVKGVIVGHGTDTMHFTAAALAFMLENCPVPVLLVGAQRSSDRGSSDAAMNLVCAAEFIAKSDFAGIAICMHASTSDDCCAILPATKTRKMHASRRDAFKAINAGPVALVNWKSKAIKFLQGNYPKQGSGKRLEFRGKLEEKTGLLYMHLGISVEQVDFFRKNGYRGLVIAGTGLGHTPIGENDSFVKAVEALVKSGCITVMTTQCLYGRVHPAVYTNIRKVRNAGVIYGENMLPETAFVKLAWLLGNYKKAEAEKMIAENLRGEITERTEPDEFELE